ncbi:MAG: ABC transporter permease [Solirubrobacteraceae bacterium]
MTTLTAPERSEAARTPARAGNRQRAFARLLGTELRLFGREPLALFWGVAFPLVLLIVLGIATSKKPQHSLGDVKFIVAYTPVVMVFTLTILALNGLPAVLASYREKGYLRRLSTTPIGAWRLLTAQIVLNFAVSAVAVILIAAIARIAFGVALPGQVGGFALAMVLGAAAMLGLGTLISAIAPSPRIAGLVGSLLFFPMMFFAGLWVPRAEMGSVLRHVSDFTPLGALVAAVQNTEAGHWAGMTHLLVLVAWALIMCLAAGRLFRWEQ